MWTPPARPANITHSPQILAVDVVALPFFSFWFRLLCSSGHKPFITQRIKRGLNFKSDRYTDYTTYTTVILVIKPPSVGVVPTHLPYGTVRYLYRTVQYSSGEFFQQSGRAVLFTVFLSKAQKKKKNAGEDGGKMVWIYKKANSKQLWGIRRFEIVIWETLLACFEERRLLWSWLRLGPVRNPVSGGRNVLEAR